MGGSIEGPLTKERKFWNCPQLLKSGTSFAHFEDSLFWVGFQDTSMDTLKSHYNELLKFVRNLSPEETVISIEVSDEVAGYFDLLLARFAALKESSIQLKHVDCTTVCVFLKYRQIAGEARNPA